MTLKEAKKLQKGDKLIGCPKHLSKKITPDYFIAGYRFIRIRYSFDDYFIVAKKPTPLIKKQKNNNKLLGHTVTWKPHSFELQNKTHLKIAENYNI